MEFMVVGLIAIVLSVFQPPAKLSRVLLLPDQEGRVGAVELRTSNQVVVLDTAYGSAVVDASGAIQVSQQSRAKLPEAALAALAAAVPRPTSFVVFFESGSASQLQGASGAVLDQLRRYLLAHPAPEIWVIGHTDRVGSVPDNDRLSRQRAETVRDFLVQSGIDGAYMAVAGRGEREPAVATADEVAEELNRRVEINVR